jgi:hypothetical protein
MEPALTVKSRQQPENIAMNLLDIKKIAVFPKLVAITYLYISKIIFIVMS